MMRICFRCGSARVWLVGLRYRCDRCGAGWAVAR